MSIGRVVLVLSVVVGLGLAIVVANSVAQEAASQSRVGDDESGRLPPGYAAVVKKSQRKEIYSIQDKYQKQIADLEKQIEQVEKQRDAEIGDVLSEKQKEVLAFILKLREDEKAEEAKAVATKKAAAATE
jgi:TolA-binding protein